MTRKDFEVIAELLSYTTIENEEAIEGLLKTTNANFDAPRFWRRVLEHKLERGKDGQ